MRARREQEHELRSPGINEAPGRCKQPCAFEGKWALRVVRNKAWNVARRQFMANFLNNQKKAQIWYLWFMELLKGRNVLLKSDKRNVYGQQRKAKRDARLFRLSTHVNNQGGPQHWDGHLTSRPKHAASGCLPLPLPLPRYHYGRYCLSATHMYAPDWKPGFLMAYMTSGNN